jgi:putative glutamine amidotransferase
MSGKRPLIGVTTSARGGRLMWWFNALAVWRAGGKPVRLTAGRPGPEKPLDGLIVGGGDDVDARLYGGDLRMDVRLDPERDALEYRMLTAARAADLPVLGICRGAQILNVFLGGTLHSDIYEAYAGLPRQRALLPLKRVRISPDSRLHRIIGLDVCRVNSLHHQSVDKVAPGLKVAGMDRHGIVQALDAETGTFVVGVQWHPEFLVFNRPQQRLFRALVAAAKAHGAARSEAAHGYDGGVTSVSPLPG